MTITIAANTARPTYPHIHSFLNQNLHRFALFQLITPFSYSTSSSSVSSSSSTEVEPYVGNRLMLARRSSGSRGEDELELGSEVDATAMV